MSEGFKLNIRLDDAAFRATADIAKYDKATQDKIKAAIADGIKTVYEEAVNRAPKRTGAFIKGIKMEGKGAHTKSECAFLDRVPFLIEMATRMILHVTR